MRSTLLCVKYAVQTYSQSVHPAIDMVATAFLLTRTIHNLSLAKNQTAYPLIVQDAPESQIHFKADLRPATLKKLAGPHEYFEFIAFCVNFEKIEPF